MDIAYDGTWGYHPLLISLANTGEPLFLVNRSGNRPSHEQAAEYLEKRLPQARIATAFPLASALRRPEFGYVRHSLRAREIDDFSAANVAPLVREDVAVLVLYSEAWDPLGLMQNQRWTSFLRKYYGYSPPVGPDEVQVLLGAHRVARWTRHGQWIEIYQR